MDRDYGIDTASYSKIGSGDSSNTESRSDVVAACEIIKDRFYFATLRCKPRSTSRTHYFCIDNELIYENFYSDFGPLNLAHIYRYCTKVNKKLKSYTLAKKKIVHYTSEQPNPRVNAAFLSGCYQIIYLNKNATDVYKLLISSTRQQNGQINHLAHGSGITREVLAQKGAVYKSYRDAALGPPLYLLTLLDCLVAVEKAKGEGWLDFEASGFNVDEYEYYERVENGDLNWLIPGQFIAFCGPHNKSKIEDGYPLHSPESYFPLFRKYNVTDIVRLNKKMYNAKRFEDAGFDHHDLFFIDGSCPSEEILQKFLQMCERRLKPECGLEQIGGVLAVHCKAGLGRTGTLIAAYIMKHYRWTASEIIGWLRICRPGSVIGPQQIYLNEIQNKMYREGAVYHKKHNSVSTVHNFNNNNASEHVSRSTGSRDSKLYQKVLAAETQMGPNGLTQGDRLRAVKSIQQHSPVTSSGSRRNQLEERTISAHGLGEEDVGFGSQSSDGGYRMITRSRSKVELPSELKLTSSSSTTSGQKRQRGQQISTAKSTISAPTTLRPATSAATYRSTNSINNHNHHNLPSTAQSTKSSASNSRPRSISHEQYGSTTIANQPVAVSGKTTHHTSSTTANRRRSENTHDTTTRSSDQATTSSRRTQPRIASDMAKMKLANSGSYNLMHSNYKK